MTRRLLTLVAGLVLATAPAFGQAMETYQAQKKAEKSEPNRFLKAESLEKTDQLGRYYRRAFSDRQTRTGSIFGQRAGAATVGTEDGTMLTGVFEGPVDPATYMLGPMDVLAVNIWGDMPAALTAVVTPEASVLVPTVGEISVRNRSLADAKTLIGAEVKRRYPRAEATVTLMTPRIFTVHVSGVVATPGVYEASPVDRAERIIALASMVKPQGDAATTSSRQYLEDPDRNISYAQAQADRMPAMSLRAIRILRGRDTLGVDLLRYYATGDVGANPTLLDGDVVVVPPEQLAGNTVGISGAVRLPGTYEYRAGDSLSLMLRIAQGFTERAITDSVEVLRTPASGAAMQRLVVDGARVLRGEIDLALEVNDRVLVRERRAPAAMASVTIRGEVQRPGSYPVSADGTRLTEVLAMAGGFSDKAAQAEVMVYRQDPNAAMDPLRSIPDYERLTDLRLSDMNKEEREYFTLESAIKRNTAAFDARRLFITGDKAADITLRDGDEIVVPETQHTVYVFGQVARPGHVTFVKDADLDYYLDHAGGTSAEAKTGDIRVIKAGSKNWVDPDDTPIEPGDAIWIPRKLERDFFFYFTAIRDVLQASVAIATVYLLLQQIKGR